MPSHVLKIVMAAILATGIIACGGSSSGTTLQPPPVAIDELPITPANAADITADVIDAISSLFDLLEVTDVTNVPLPDLPLAKSSLAVTSLPFARVAESPFSGQSLQTTRSVIVDTDLCTTGSFTNTWDDADNNLEMSTGDTLEIDFADCFFADMGVTLVGSTYVTSVTMTGDVMNAIPPWDFSANFAFIDLVGTDSDGAITVNGSFAIDVASTDGLMLDLELSGTQISAVEDGNTDTLRNFRVTEQFDLAADTIVIDAVGTLTSDSLNGTISFATPTRLTVIGDDNPSSGQITITHATSGLVATVLSNLNVELAIDADGDGMAETTLVISWADLDLDA